jgi:hypothetical protein
MPGCSRYVAINIHLNMPTNLQYSAAVVTGLPLKKGEIIWNTVR